KVLLSADIAELCAGVEGLYERKPSRRAGIPGHNHVLGNRHAGLVRRIDDIGIGSLLRHRTWIRRGRGAVVAVVRREVEYESPRPVDCRWGRFAAERDSVPAPDAIRIVGFLLREQPLGQPQGLLADEG